MPRSLGGGEDLGNLALSCESCNLYKSDKTFAWDEEAKQTAPLFHPRQDTWNEHFHYDSETGRVEGMTAIGRATVLRLKMNSDAQIRARQQWGLLGLYP